MVNDSKHKKQFEEAKKLHNKGVDGDKEAVKSARRIRCTESGRYFGSELKRNSAVTRARLSAAAGVLFSLLENGDRGLHLPS